MNSEPPGWADILNQVSETKSGRKAATDLRINVSEIRKRLGTTQTVDVAVVLDEIKVIESTAGGDVKGQLTLTSIEHGLTLFGEISFFWKSACRRCLEDIVSEQKTTIDEILQENASEDSDIIDFDGIHVDLLPIVVEAIAFSLPLAPLCKEGCAGPAPEEYPTQTEEELAANKPADPRWDALKDLRFD